MAIEQISELRREIEFFELLRKKAKLFSNHLILHPEAIRDENFSKGLVEITAAIKSTIEKCQKEYDTLRERTREAMRITGIEKIQGERIRGFYLAYTIRSFKVDDIDDVPDEFIKIDLDKAKVLAMIKKGHSVPGVKIGDKTIYFGTKSEKQQRAISHALRSEKKRLDSAVKQQRAIYIRRKR